MTTERDLIAAAFRQLGLWAGGRASGERTLLKIESLFLDRYRIVALKGRGAFGEVYQAHDSKLSRSVAIKVLPANRLDSSPRLRQRLQNEIMAAGSLGHPHIVTIFDGESKPGEHGYIIMEFMSGGTAQDAVVESGALPWEKVVKHLIDLCDALEAIHRQRFVHRDIKPANILFTSGDRRIAKLGDLGLIHIPATELTQEGVMMGTLSCMSPEQCSGESPNPRWDIYALGATAYHMLSGQQYLPREAFASMPRLIHAIAYEPVMPLDSVADGLPVKLVEVVHKALAKDPGRRFQSAAEFIEALKSVEEVTVGMSAQDEPKRKPNILIRSSESSNVIRVPRLPRFFSREEFKIEEAKPGDIWIWPSDGAEMVFVPAGNFQMGSNNGLLQERPERTSRTGAYLIDRFPVTNACFKRFLDKVKDYPVPNVDADWGEQYNWDPLIRTYPVGQNDYPVIMVSFDDARAYAAWAGKRLPTEIEWEKAAGWDPGANARRLYPWGDEWLANRANSAERVAGRSFAPIAGGRDEAHEWFQLFRQLDQREASKFELLTKVHAFPAGASALGVMDMAGNVHEWCEADPSVPPCPDPRTPPEEFRYLRACRGGAWADHPFYLRTCSRYALRGSSRADRVGFRCSVYL